MVIFLPKTRDQNGVQIQQAYFLALPCFLMLLKNPFLIFYFALVISILILPIKINNEVLHHHRPIFLYFSKY